MHYLLELQKGRDRYQNEAEAARDVSLLEKSGILDVNFYRDKYRNLIAEGCDPRIHFLTAGQVLHLDASQHFSTRFYVRTYPDLRSLVRPAMHYALHGHTENRIGTSSAELSIALGRANQDPGKPTLLLALHEASRTGAPILGYNLVRHLSRQFNVIVWLIRPGVLEKDLASHAVAVVKSPAVMTDVPEAMKAVALRFQIDVAILNSAVCHPIAHILYDLKIPVVTLAHEFADYTLPRGNIAKLAMFSDCVICPSPVISNSISEECIDYLGWAPNHFEIRHQGNCQLPPVAASGARRTERGLPPKVKAALDRKPGRPVVLGAGTVHMRKGVELFIHAAQMFKQTHDPDVLFIWVGSNFNPKADLFYSVWLQSQVELSDLQDNVIFADEAPSLQPFYEASDVFFMSSRLDPFPNVAIDASLAGLPIIAFERATGFADVFKENPVLGRGVPSFDLNGAVDAIDELIGARRKNPNLTTEIKRAAEAIFDFKSYADFVAARSQSAIAHAKALKDGAKVLQDSGSLDESFLKSGMINGYLNQLFDAEPEYIFLDLARKGIFPLKARPGSNIANQTHGDGSVEAVLAAIGSNRQSYDHPVQYLQVPRTGVDRTPPLTSIAVHIHAYETDGVQDVIMRLHDSPIPISIYVTSDTDEKIESMSEAVSGFDRHIRWIKTPNIGRDIGPFVCGLPEDFWAHELIGHFHIKASSHLDQQFTDQWKAFVYDHLLGGGDIMQQIFEYFANAPDLGLLFPEDPCQIGWTKNRTFASALAARLGIEEELPPVPEFPVGDMFWARSAAFLPLRKLELTWDDFPGEPVAADGTILHALERMSPEICRLAGFTWATVHHPHAVRYSSGKN